MSDFTIEEITRLKDIVNNFKNNQGDDQNWNWLDKLNPSQAFLACVGAGPWKIKRRQLIQKQAILALENKDLAEIDEVGIFKFPLKWQNDKTQYLINYLRRYKITMTWFCGFIADMNEPIKMLYEITQTKGRAKVLDLFARDYLKVEAFPIDRWVERTLIQNNFPVNEKYMIELCKAAELEARIVSKLFINNSEFTGNAKIEL